MEPPRCTIYLATLLSNGSKRDYTALMVILKYSMVDPEAGTPGISAHSCIDGKRVVYTDKTLSTEMFAHWTKIGEIIEEQVGTFRKVFYGIELADNELFVCNFLQALVEKGLLEGKVAFEAVDFYAPAA